MAEGAGGRSRAVTSRRPAGQRRMSSAARRPRLHLDGPAEHGAAGDALASFSRPFREGMFQEDRLRRLGDRAAASGWRRSWRADRAGAPTPRRSELTDQRVGAYDVRVRRAEEIISTPITVHALLLLYTRTSRRRRLGGCGGGGSGPARDRRRPPLAGSYWTWSRPVSAASISASPTACRNPRPTTRRAQVDARGPGRCVEPRSGAGRAAGRVPDRATSTPITRRRPGRSFPATPRIGRRRLACCRTTERARLLRPRPQRQLHGGARAEADVAAFWKSMDEKCGKNPRARSGRNSPTSPPTGWPSASSAATATATCCAPAKRSCCPPDNDFICPTERLRLVPRPIRTAIGCPPGSHVRRANPARCARADRRTRAQNLLDAANNHRILRRGRKFGPTLDDARDDDGADRGLLFICLNTDIARQFEFVQQTWLFNTDFATLFEETDPLVGPKGRLTIREQPLRRIVARGDLHPDGRRRVFLPAEPSGAPNTWQRYERRSTTQRGPAARPAAGSSAGWRAREGWRSRSASRMPARHRPDGSAPHTSIYVVTRHDDVREVFLTTTSVPCSATQGTWTSSRAASRSSSAWTTLPTTATRAPRDAAVMRPRMICPAPRQRGREAGRRDRRRLGRALEVVDQLVRRVTFEVLDRVFRHTRVRPGGCASGRPGCSNSSSPARRRTATARTGGRDRARVPRAHRPRDRAPEGGRRPARRRSRAVSRAAGGRGAGFSDDQIRTAFCA